jgi:hypothetical protein
MQAIRPTDLTATIEQFKTHGIPILGATCGPEQDTKTRLLEKQRADDGVSLEE